MVVLKCGYVVYNLCHFLLCVSIQSGGSSDLIGGFADFSSPAASASLPTSTGKLSLAFLSSSKRTVLSHLQLSSFGQWKGDIAAF